MKKVVVYCLTMNGVTAVYFCVEDLCDSIKMEFEDQDFDSMKNCEYKIWTKEMTEKEIDDLPEFEGF
tara:strand:+ start:6786 stop:6986 length:201 start_codon:yes stop_codon:yes gene_type:complete